MLVKLTVCQVGTPADVDETIFPFRKAREESSRAKVNHIDAAL
jgi:hypothetical protein